MGALKKHPYAFFTLFVSLFGLLEAVFSPLLSHLADEGLAITVPLGYLAQALAVVAPFLMVGAVAHAMCGRPFGASLSFFGIYAAVKLLVQFPIAIYEYSESLSSPYLLVLGVYLLTAALDSLVFLCLLWLGYLLFARGECTHEIRFLGARGTDTRVLWLSVAAIAVQDVVLFVLSFIEHLRSKLYLFEAADLADILISLVFIALCALLSYAVGRFSMKAFGDHGAPEDEA